ncbi:helix-turn-helix domain-containing protein [Arenibacter troitsensis]|uniref:Transposase n=1 Tax=Arenibacter troitsensis TaxID=188872 RepID=A0A1X7ISU3_9FLAO|nr:helix-turn-helix domain-containing protein [Arenibacter troitsensis]SMG18181.1 transposase [Arenibacter troitsensis]
MIIPRGNLYNGDQRECWGCREYPTRPQQINLWKREFLTRAEAVFDTGSKSKKTEAEQKEEHLLKVIGQQKVELDFLKDALR